MTWDQIQILWRWEDIVLIYFIPKVSRGMLTTDRPKQNYLSTIPQKLTPDNFVPVLF
jgi:hypothetical protein